MKHPVVDDKLSCYGAIHEIHHLIHLAKVWNASGYFEALANDGTIDFLIRTGSDEVHLDWQAGCGGNAVIFGCEGVVAQTAAGVVLGTVMTAYNKYREHKTDATGVLLWIVPALVSTGLCLMSQFVPAGQKATAGGGVGEGRHEWILDPNTDYAMRILNIAGTAQDFGAVLEYYEIKED